MTLNTACKSDLPTQTIMSSSRAVVARYLTYDKAEVNRAASLLLRQKSDGTSTAAAGNIKCSGGT